MAFIYLITNNINNKVYIGKSKYNNPNYYGSGLKIKNALLKYGKSNFSKKIIEECDDNILSQREIFWIGFYNSTTDNLGYNISIGGEGGSHYWSSLSDEQKELHRNKISVSKKGKARKPHSEETKRKIAAGFKRDSEFIKRRAAKKCKLFTCINHSNNTIYHVTDLKSFCNEHRLSYANMLYNSKTRKNFTEKIWSCRKNHLEKNISTIRTIQEELRIAHENIAHSIKKHPRKGENNPMYGKKHSISTIEKIRKSCENRKDRDKRRS